MPWCPRCDETFPQGPACPRCNARLVARERETTEDTLVAVPALRGIKVSRRYLRALERLNAPRQSSSRALALALVLLVFASGFLLGRVGSVGPSTPTVQALPLAEPLPFDPDRTRAVSYLINSRDPLSTIVLHDLYSGHVQPLARFSPPPGLGAHVDTSVVSFGRSVAVVVLSDGSGWVAVAPSDRAQHAWVPGIQAAWISETELIIRRADGAVAKWTANPDSLSSQPVGEADEVVQKPGGAAVRRGRVIATANAPHRELTLPARTKLIAVSADTTRAIVDPDRPALWDGHTKVRLRADAGRAIGASFEGSGERAAVLLSRGDELTLAITDVDGDAALKPLGTAEPCGTAPAWDAWGRWVYVSTSDGVLHAVEVGGGRIEAIKTHGVGCGLAWVDAG